MKKYLFHVIFVLMWAVVSQAQWQPDVRLTIGPSSSLLCYNNARPLAASGPILHVMWYDNRDGNEEIYYKQSTNAGISWGPGTRLTNNSAYSLIPSVTVSNLVVHVVWVDRRDGNFEIYYKRSPDEGISWGSDTRLTNNPFSSTGPCISVSGSVVHVVWEDDRDGNWEVYYKRSTDGGISWGADTRMTIYSASSGLASVAVSSSVVHVVWQDDRDGNWEIYYRRSPDNGLSWGVDKRLTSNSASSEHPSVTVSGSAVHVVWQDDRDGNFEIYYKQSTNAGINWGPGTRLTYYSAYSIHPSITVSGSVVHVVWYDYRDGNDEIYYKRDPTGNPFGITKIGTEIPKEFKLYVNYPNPFNPVTLIKFDIPKDAEIKLIIYDVLGREVAVLVNEHLKPGTYETGFDGTNFPSGVYLYKLEASDYVEVRKMALVK